MPEFHLEFCYYTLFRDFPVMLLRKWQYFLWDQNYLWDKVDNLRGFDKRFDDVIKIFEKHNFVKEYDDRYRNTEDWHEHPSFENCKLKLLNLRHVIQNRGHENLTKDIDNILRKYEHIDSNDLPENEMDPGTRDFLAILEKYKHMSSIFEEHDKEGKLRPEGALRISHLLSRMQNL